MAIANQLRPHPDQLRELPTLRVQTPANGGEELQAVCRERGIDYVLELKLETPHARYWLIKEYVENQPGSGWTGWQAGNAIAESLQPNENGECEMMPYSADDVKLLRGFDYLKALTTELERLDPDGDNDPESWEMAKELDALRKEIMSIKPA